MNPEMSVDAASLPEGTMIRHEGRLFTAYPPMSWEPSIRWLSDGPMLTDEAATNLLAAGAQVVGCNPEAIALYKQILSDARDH